MVSGAQLRSARAVLNWSAKTLAEKSGISLRTIMRLEQVDGLPPSHSGTLSELKKTLEAAGIEFIGTPERGPGVRLWKGDRPD